MPELKHFNAYRSKCLNGSKIEYKDNELSVSGTKSDKCYAYFDNNSFVEDLSGNGNHGKAINIASWDSDGVTTSNDTKNGYVNCGLLGYDFQNQLSVILRTKINKWSNNIAHYFGNWESGGFGFLSDLNSSKFQFWLYTNHYNIVTSKEDAKINKWYTLVATYDNQKLKIYINGSLDSSIDLTGNIKTVNTILAIGVNPIETNQEGYYSYNIVSDALVFNRALTEEEIANDYADKINPTNKANLLLWYKFN